MTDYLSHKRTVSSTYRPVPLQTLFKPENKFIRDKRDLHNLEPQDNVASDSFHRRSYSTTCQKNAFKSSPNPTPPPKPLKNSEFIGVLNAASIYFEEEQRNPIIFPPCELDFIREKIQNAFDKNSEIQKEIESLQQEYKEMCDYIEEQKQSKETLDKSIQSLKALNLRIDNDIVQASTTLNSIKASTVNSFSTESARTQPPSPVPIKYKPLSKRMQRNYVNNK
jgi:predicted HicB family RNase H-like nuclease